MKLPALVVSAVRLLDVPVGQLSKEIEINRSVLTRALSGADLPEKYFAPLCAAVGLQISGEKWDSNYVARWHIHVPEKKGVSPNVQDLATALVALKTPHTLRVGFVRGAYSWQEHREIAISNAKPVGKEISWCVYIVSGGAVRRLLYVDASLRKDVENMLASAGTLERLIVTDSLDRKIGDIWDRFSSSHLPEELDSLVKLVRAGDQIPN